MGINDIDPLKSCWSFHTSKLESNGIEPRLRESKKIQNSHSCYDDMGINYTVPLKSCWAFYTSMLESDGSEARLRCVSCTRHRAG